MYYCERCGSSFSPIRISSPDSCPRCLAREGIRAALTYKLFSEPESPSPRDEDVLVPDPDREKE
jgi:hypothetical protein